MNHIRFKIEDEKAKKKLQKRKPSVAYNQGVLEFVLKDFLGHISEAAYRVALRFGFKGSFISFLDSLEDSLEQILHRNKPKKVHFHS